jgi:uncharacterized protein (DUF58 family)
MTPDPFFTAERRTSNFAHRTLFFPRSARPTKEGLRFIILTLAIGIAAINTGNNLLYLLLAMMLSLIVLSGILSERCLKHLVVRRGLPEHIFANSPVMTTVAVTNGKRYWPVFSVHVADLVEGTSVERGIHFFHLRPKGTDMKACPLLVTRRGRYRIDGVKLLTRFPFGLFVRSLTVPDATERVIYPETRSLPDKIRHDLAAVGQERAISQRGHGGGLYQLRDYREGDDSRSIHWKSSARHAAPIVRDPEAEEVHRVMLIFPPLWPGAVDEPGGVFPSDHPFERAVTLTASLATYFHDLDYAVGLHVGTETLPPDVGRTHLYRLLRALACCAPVPPSEAGAVLSSLRHLGQRSMPGDFRVLILPGPDPEAETAAGPVAQVFHAQDCP